MAEGAGQLKPLWRRIAETPLAFDARLAEDRLAELEAAAHASLAPLLAEPAVRDLLAGTLGSSPYLAGLILRDPARLARILDTAPELHMTDLGHALEADMLAAATPADAMRILRQYKTEVALLVALADLGGVWPVMTVTGALSDAADATTTAAVRFLFNAAIAKGDWLATAGPHAEANSGYIVLGMGKHGARELNYSSDIDLIVFYEPELVNLRAGLEPLAFFVRMTRDLVRFMQERTGDGYVFRTDLRLRPDPGATQVAISTNAALNYYESFGQNWERAAMIKARAVAGDIPAGVAFVKELAPFVWRKYLDFAAIADIHAMKRQIHAFKGFGEIGVAGHNIKVGRGGIREIEFFAQTQQLIAGGRQPDLREPDTLGALAHLVDRGWIKPEVRDDLTDSYLFLRRIEHRLQMIADEQTQTLPADAEGLLRLSRFSGFPDTAAFSAALVAHLERVQRHYGALFEDVPELTRGNANMVFAGEQDDPGTVEALTRMGYKRPSDIIGAVRGWHHGRYQAVRTPRARELLTEVQPTLIEALSRTSDPDQAFLGFDRFLSQLPSGVQLFSLLRNNPRLLRLVADIMGSAPRLARIMSRRRRVLDAVLDPGFFGSLPDADALARIVDAEIDATADYQEALDRARIVGSEQAFLIGVRVLSGTITAAQAGGAYAALAEHLIAALQRQVEREIVAQSGHVAGGAASVVAMGKLGGCEMTAASDLDLILVYDFDPAIQQSDGPRPLAPSQYFTRFTQRLITALSSPTAEGALYEVDMRLRPSGQKGPVATQLSSFEHYQENEAWTWEHMALTRARVISGPPELRARVEAAIRRALVRPRDRAELVADVRDMRERIAKEKGTEDIWELKQVRGGLVDIEFIAQFLQLAHADAHPEVLDQNTINALKKLAAAGLLSTPHADILLPAARLVHNLTEVLRLCLDGPFDPSKAPDGLRELLSRAGDAPDFTRLEASLRTTLADVAGLFDEIVS
ncbi:bifunctional [glutamine synthetase] adenylyltransferase/[glutamine synthetase]-adenylyl-L-tyrosine phosphorylase [Hyphomicrobium sp. CS1BSMeth3]|uniref:bifunctional [glutamine synthetase] adenylyltransferase/[glutamine synthetase]-adenylyl-L-tyrosine phosphorylase n=1 Tax=Hyphomicrobium sp. CS1BSMeth3 TaxID=1892844 RepID=UPI000931B587|nr:bifunctional [glutamine synthetase] adenylyltransferase/[glutamine synthetase]-adenylyl-L-tyrosine phosphorylase [Hyphomicrobium sp. CS1BSMeth3]